MDSFSYLWRLLVLLVSGDIYIIKNTVIFVLVDDEFLLDLSGDMSDTHKSIYKHLFDSIQLLAASEEKQMTRETEGKRKRTRER